MYVSAKDNTERAQCVEYDAQQGLTRKATEAEKPNLALLFNQSLGSPDKRDPIFVVASPK